MKSRTAVWFLCVAALLLFVRGSDALAFEWIAVAPNPAYSRDLAMGASTLAMSFAPQSQSINPAGLTLFSPRDDFHATVFLNPGGLWQLKNYADREAGSRPSLARAGDGARLLLHGAALQSHIITLAAFVSQPVMARDDTARYHRFEQRSSLDYHQNSLSMSLALHPRVSVGGRVDRYYRYDRPEGESYSYGVILRPRGMNVGVQYQRFPASGARVWHPLDRRSDQSTSAGVAVVRETFTVSAQVMNLTQSDQPAFLEPHAGFEWRPVRALAIRAGGVQFSRSADWAWTSGIGLLDANWLRSKVARLLVPDDVLQVAVAVVYHRRTPRLGIGSLTCAWRL
ncbi:MAG TPA: hypothetical protein VGL38_05390 [bacterium]